MHKVDLLDINVILLQYMKISMKNTVRKQIFELLKEVVKNLKLMK